MATLTVWKFPDAFAADQAETLLKGLQAQHLITIHDAAVVSWPTGNKKPTTRQLADLKKSGGLGGAFWGLLFGLVFFMPLIGAAVGAAVGAATGSMRDVGIDDAFIKSVREKVTPGTSALFLMSSDAVVEKVRGTFAGKHAELIMTNLSSEQEQVLRELFADHG